MALGGGLIRSEPEACGGEEYGREEVSGELVEACGDASEVFELTEEALDEIALPIEVEIDRALQLAILLSGDVGTAAVGLDEIDDGLGVIAAISDESPGRRKAFDQGFDSGLVRSLAWREYDPQRQAILVHQDVDLGAQSSTRTADGVIRAPFLPPAACWWARMMELSIRCKDWGDFATKASNTRSHTPAFAHLLYRL